MEANTSTLAYLSQARELQSDTNDRLQHATCQSDYWLDSLWSAFLSLLRFLEQDGTTLEDVRDYGKGLVIPADYGKDDSTNTCMVDQDGSWQVKPVPGVVR